MRCISLNVPRGHGSSILLQMSVNRCLWLVQPTLDALCTLRGLPGKFCIPSKCMCNVNLKVRMLCVQGIVGGKMMFRRFYAGQSWDPFGDWTGTLCLLVLGISIMT